MRYSPFPILATVLLGACATVGQLQADCESKSGTFPEMATCLRTAVAASDRPGMQSNPEVKLYLLKADQLSQRVSKGEISDLDARVELQTMYVNLRNQQRSAAAAAAGTRPRTTNCFAVGNSVQCNTY